MTTAAPRRALLDTSVLIDFPADAVAAAADELAVSAISLGELHCGVSAAAEPLEQLRRRQRLELVEERFELLPFDAAVAAYYGALATLVRQTGRDPRPRRLDLQIAATAARHNLALLTRNGGDFAGVRTAVEIVEL